MTVENGELKAYCSENEYNRARKIYKTYSDLDYYRRFPRKSRGMPKNNNFDYPSLREMGMIYISSVSGND